MTLCVQGVVPFLCCSNVFLLISSYEYFRLSVDSPFKFVTNSGRVKFHTECDSLETIICSFNLRCSFLNQNVDIVVT